MTFASVRICWNIKTISRLFYYFQMNNKPGVGSKSSAGRFSVCPCLGTVRNHSKMEVYCVPLSISSLLWRLSFWRKRKKFSKRISLKQKSPSFRKTCEKWTAVCCNRRTNYSAWGNAVLNQFETFHCWKAGVRLEGNETFVDIFKSATLFKLTFIVIAPHLHETSQNLPNSVTLFMPELHISDCD